MSTYHECKAAEAKAQGADGWAYAANLWLQCYDTNKELREAEAQACKTISDSIRKGDEFRATHQVCGDCNLVIEIGAAHDCRVPTNHGILLVKDRVI